MANLSDEIHSNDARDASVDIKIEVVVIPVSDVDRAEEFYARLGWPGSAQRTYLIVSDIEAARDALVAAGVDVSAIFHLGPAGPLPGPDPEHRTYRSLASFSDPDGNSWLLQEITTRLPGRVDSATTSFGSASDLASAFRRAEAAHGEHEQRLGRRDENWSDWYAEYMAAEQSGAELPQ